MKEIPPPKKARYEYNFNQYKHNQWYLAEDGVDFPTGKSDLFRAALRMWVRNRWIKCSTRTKDADVAFVILSDPGVD